MNIIANVIVSEFDTKITKIRQVEPNILRLKVPEYLITGLFRLPVSTSFFAITFVCSEI